MNNPWMNLWVSSASAMLGAPLAQAASVGQRQLEVISTKAAEDLMSFWMTAWVPPLAVRRRTIR